jgi:hypothetical protein
MAPCLIGPSAIRLFNRYRPRGQVSSAGVKGFLARIGLISAFNLS